MQIFVWTYAFISLEKAKNEAYFNWVLLAFGMTLLPQTTPAKQLYDNDIASLKVNITMQLIISYSLSESVGEKKKVGRMEESKEEREGDRKGGE